MRKPNFEGNMLKVLQGKAPERATLFELFMNMPIYERFAGRKLPEGASELEVLKLVTEAYAAAGYDYATTHASAFGFPKNELHNAATKHGKSTISLNEDNCIVDWASFERYVWPSPESFDTSKLGKISESLPEGMKLMVMGPGGVLENVISLVGYDNLCYMLYDEPELVRQVFDHVGDALVRYYETAVEYDSVGFLCSNDDWGFNTQTFLSVADMRKYVFPWHKKIVEVAHKHGKPCILHSCGRFDEVLEDIICDMRYDARHSYEDKILCVEDSYELMHDRIAVLGGMDVGFIMTAPIEQIKSRARAMFERTRTRGGYALGTGNSVPEYLPQDRFMALIEVAHEGD